MELTLEQKRLIALTAELKEKASYYSDLCKELEGLKKQKIDSNSSIYADLLERFVSNNAEIKAITSELNKLKNVK